VNELRMFQPKKALFLFTVMICVLALSTISGTKGGATEEGVNITLTTEQGFSAIGPDKDLARYTLSVVDDEGNPIPYSHVSYTLETPKKNMLFSTDFPIVEGTTLMQSDLVLEDGTYTFDYLIPIRGEYRLMVNAQPTEKSPITFSPTEKEVRFTINENPEEVVNGFILFGIVSLIGLISGFIFARSRYRVQGALLLLILIFSVQPIAQAHENDEQGETSGGVEWIGGEVMNDDVHLSVDFNPKGATVGELTTISGEVQDHKEQLIENIKVKITTYHIEDEKVMFEGEFLSLDGTFSWNNQFFDGAEHKVIVTATPTSESIDFKPITTEYVIDVTGINPPNTVIVKTMIFLLLLTFLGMGIGYQTTKKLRQRKQHYEAA
jgi:hypothetical protein